MNRIYKLKFDKRRNELVVVSEITAGVGKAKTTGSVDSGKASRRGVRTMALSLLSGMIMMAHPVTAANLPAGGQIVAGSGSIQTPSGNQMNIHQNSQNMVANWNSFDIGKGHTVQFYQPDSSSVALNRVVGGGESQIMGNLKANGQVFLVNPNGVLFGKDASVSTSGFVASTRDIKNDDFMNRRYTFSGGQKQGAGIVNQGALTTNAGGYIVLAADKVSNSGSIRTPGGKAVLAATERVTLQLDRGGLTSVQVSGDVVNALVENRGLVSARNGQVYLTAHGRDMLMNTVLNVSGVVEAGGMHLQDGNIVLDGGNSGVVHLSGALQADNASGRGGKVVVQGQNLLLDKGSSITATGSQGGGEVYAGGGWQGKDGRIKNADKVVMQKGARIDVSATQKGNGGTAVLWSESFTNFRGEISAKGGEQGGNGGQVETSSRGNLQAFGSVTASAKKGQAGNWLLDPEDITVTSNNDSNINNSTVSNTTIFKPNGTGSMVSNTTINNQLNNGTSVTIQTSGDGSTASGNITVNADITKSSGSNANLTLKADGNITITEHNITSTAGKLNISLLGAGSKTGRVMLTNASLSSNGGDITIDRMSGGESNAMTVKVVNSTLNASATGSRGNITIKAYNPNINLSESQWNNSVRNSGSLLEINNSTLSGQNLTLEGNQSGENSSHLPVYLNNATLTSEGGNITLMGESTNGSNGAQLELRGNNTLMANNGSITISHNASGAGSVLLNGNNTLMANNGSITISHNASGAGSVRLNGSNTLNATNSNISLTGNRVEVKGANISAGNFTLNATATGSEISNSTVNASHDINLTATANSTASGIYLKDASLTSQNGSIVANGNNTANGSATHLDNNVTLTASSGNITLRGTSNDTSAFNNQGVYNGNGVTLNGNLAFTGNTAIYAISNIGAAVMMGHSANLTFNNGTVVINATNNGMDASIYTAAFAMYRATGNRNSISQITLNNSNLTINTKSQESYGIAGWNNGEVINSRPNLTDGNVTLWNVTGNGSLMINAFSEKFAGYDGLSINASTLQNGSAIINGSSNGSHGVILTNSHMNNITINGCSSGVYSGVLISSDEETGASNSTAVMTNATITGS
ncbi:TPA: filamentous hemagglutinin N-terminal domain-containing protein, partial [Escherichia coli]|nr:filamentous hemagglutinin N-terminal domain-containing protein [Escherichia coli]